jgi:hypothetical protein
MVKLREYFYNCKFLKKLNEVSDNCCDDNGNKYIDFDLIDSNLATVDTLIIRDKYLVFVEFKRFEVLDKEKIEKWINNKEKIQQINLKGYESYFIVKNLCKKLNVNNFEEIEKRFILVYKAEDAKKKIKNHFKSKINRLQVAYNLVIVRECNNFIKLLQRIENVF